VSKQVGQVLAVTGSQLTIEVDSEISDLHIRHNGVTHTVGQPGTYLIVEGGHDKYLVLVTTVRKSQWAPTDTPQSPSTAPLNPLEGNFPYLLSVERQIDRTLIDGILVGTIVGRSFEVGISRLPVVGDSVTLALEKHLRIALSPPKDRAMLSIGSYAGANLAVHLDLDHLLGKHTALVGTTGCGKSYAVARLIQEIACHYPSANIIVFDLHGEYRNCFELSRCIRADLLKLPAWLHSFDDLFQLCADLGNQFNIHNQRWAFRDAVFQLKQRYCRDVMSDAELADNIDLDAPIPFDFKYLQNYLHNLNNHTVNSGTNDLAVEENEDVDWFCQRINFKATKLRSVSPGPLHGQLDRLVLRVDSRVRDPRYAFMFQYDIPEENELLRLTRKLSGFMGEDSSSVTVFDLSYLPSETVGTFVATISRILFQVHFLSERFNSAPTLVVYEEAHNYISQRGGGAYGEARQSVERIAKEGRKFGIGTMVVSQRPSELSETLLSQCNTFLCMRLANNIDKNHIVALLPESLNMLVDILPALPRGHVIAIGQAAKMPVRFLVTEIEKKERRPYSEDPEFGRHWSKSIEERCEPDIAKVCDQWIRSERPGPEKNHL